MILVPTIVATSGVACQPSDDQIQLSARCEQLVRQFDAAKQPWLDARRAARQPSGDGGSTVTDAERAAIDEARQELEPSQEALFQSGCLRC